MLHVSPEIVVKVIDRARMFDVKDQGVDPDSVPGSNPTDDEQFDALEDLPGDTSGPALEVLIANLNQEEQTELVAMTWLGRGDYAVADWEDARQAAKDAWTRHTARYLMGIPMLGDYLQDGMEQLGFAYEGYQSR